MHHRHVAYNLVQLLKNLTLCLVIGSCWSWRSQGHDDISWKFPVCMSKSSVSQWGCLTLHSHHRTAMQLAPILHTDPNTVQQMASNSLDGSLLTGLNSLSSACWHAQQPSFLLSELESIKDSGPSSLFTMISPDTGQRPTLWKQQVSLHSLALYDVWLILFIRIMHGNNVLSHIMWEAIALLAILTHLIPTRALWGKCAHYYLTDKETRHREAEWHAKSQGGNWWSRVCIQAVCLTVFVLWILKMHVVYVYVSCVCMCLWKTEGGTRSPETRVR